MLDKRSLQQRVILPGKVATSNVCLFLIQDYWCSSEGPGSFAHKFFEGLAQNLLTVPYVFILMFVSTAIANRRKETKLNGLIEIWAFLASALQLGTMAYVQHFGAGLAGIVLIPVWLFIFVSALAVRFASFLFE